MWNIFPTRSGCCLLSFGSSQLQKSSEYTEMATQALVSSSSITSSAEAAKQILGGRPFQSPARKVSFVVRAASTPPVKQGADRPLWFASKQSLSYLDGSLPGDYGFDPLGLSDPEGTGGFIEPKWLAYGEVINGRFAMLGAAGAIAPEIFGKLGLIPAETALPWFQTGVIPPAGTYNYWADPFTLFRSKAPRTWSNISKLSRQVAQDHSAQIKQLEPKVQ
ncbi:hypothetical protein RJ639_042046, partial [Escallonia herrerae]